MTDRYTEQANLHAEAGMQWIRSLIPFKCESPIEEGLLKAFIALWLFDRSFKFDGMPSSPLATEFTSTIYAQYPLGTYRLDFAINVTAAADGRKLDKWIAVECDGHAFHERTREQAARDKARDRYLTAQGFHILRFTGSEIYSDSVGCATEVRALIANIYSAWCEQ